jgi:hypothetical protein
MIALASAAPPVWTARRVASSRSAAYCCGVTRTVITFFAGATIRVRHHSRTRVSRGRICGRHGASRNAGHRRPPSSGALRGFRGLRRASSAAVHLERGDVRLVRGSGRAEFATARAVVAVLRGSRPMKQQGRGHSEPTTLEADAGGTGATAGAHSRGGAGSAAPLPQSGRGTLRGRSIEPLRVVTSESKGGRRTRSLSRDLPRSWCGRCEVCSPARAALHAAAGRLQRILARPRGGRPGCYVPSV